MVELPAANSGKWPTLIDHITAARHKSEMSTRTTDPRYKCTGARSQKQKWLQPEQVDELVCAYESGATVHELAKRFECHRTTVSGHLKSRGVAMRLTPLTEQEVDRAVELYESGLSLVKVGDALKRDGETIRQRLLERCVKLRSPHDRRKHPSAASS